MMIGLVAGVVVAASGVVAEVGVILACCEVELRVFGDVGPNAILSLGVVVGESGVVDTVIGVLVLTVGVVFMEIGVVVVAVLGTYLVHNGAVLLALFTVTYVGCVGPFDKRCVVFIEGGVVVIEGGVVVIESAVFVEGLLTV
jgi:hypothetical protein